MLTVRIFGIFLAALSLVGAYAYAQDQGFDEVGLCKQQLSTLHIQRDDQERRAYLALADQQKHFAEAQGRSEWWASCAGSVACWEWVRPEPK